MIKSLRIDERLIHGQVAVAWCTTLGVDSIVVANDAAANDSVTTMSLKMAAPPHLRVVVKTVEDAIKLLNDPRIVQRKVLLLVTNPRDAITLIQKVEGIPQINVGNFGMLDKQEKTSILATSLSVTEEEYQQFKELVALRPESYYQMTPTLTPQLLRNLLEKERN